jgi:hypothetical protein
MVEALMLQVGRSWARFPMRSLHFLIYLILPAVLGPGVYSAFNRNENQKETKKFLGSNARPVRQADNFTAICEPIV